MVYIIVYIVYSGLHNCLHCLQWFTLLFTLFTDIDECADDVSECSDNALCTNTEGDHLCDCKDGYMGDGKLCNCKYYIPAQSYDIVKTLLLTHTN